MYTITTKLRSVPPVVRKTTAEQINILKPYKLRKTNGGGVVVVIKVPTRGTSDTYLFLNDCMAWCAGDDSGQDHINAFYEFIGPLESGESVTIAG